MEETGKQLGLLTWSLYVIMPILVISYLGVLMADRQVRSQFDAYGAIVEYDSLAGLATASDEAVVMVRGQLLEVPTFGPAGDLIVYQERPLDGRELRYGEEFPLNFPAIILELTDGSLIVQPSLEKENVIAHELHEVDDPGTDREYTGFRAGDVVTVQGVWISAETGTLHEATGITSLDRASYLSEWQGGYDTLRLVSNIMGVLTLISVVLFFRHLWQVRIARREAARLETPAMQS